MDYWHWILTAVTTVFGGTTFFQFLAYRSQEVAKRDISNMQTTVDMLKSQIDWLNTRLEEMQQMVVNKDAYITQLSNDKLVLEIKNGKNKTAINTALSCKYCKLTDHYCPVLIQRSLHEKEYLKRIDHAECDDN